MTCQISRKACQKNNKFFFNRLENKRHSRPTLAGTVDRLISLHDLVQSGC